MPGPELPKAYRPADHEERIRARWDAARAFHADPTAVNGRAPYAIVIPPPNVTAALHLGHALNNTLQDVLARAHRMMGDETLWMPGTDHAGIATQTVVEKRLQKEEGKRRTDYPRDEFVAKVQAFKDEYEAIITGQLKAMGCSCDWDRQRFTMDEVCARAVREAFFRLFQDGLIYRGKRLVNWDPVTQTVLADDEVEMEEVDGHFYYLRYPLCDAAGKPIKVRMLNLATGAQEELDHVTVATTRPETYLGDTAVAVNPRDPRWAALSAAKAHVRLPFVNRIIPVLADDYVVMPSALNRTPSASEGSTNPALALGAQKEGKEDAKAAMATGFLKVTPAHDPNDAEIGKRHNLDAINVMAPDASISDKHGWTDTGDAKRFLGMSREDARKAVVAAFREANLLEGLKPHRHSVGHSYRSHAPIEPYLSDQWYIAVKKPIPSLPDKGLIAGTDVPVHSLAGLALTPILDTTESSGGAGVSPAASAGIPESLTKRRRRLPHWEKGGSAYFVTFRVLEGTLSETERRAVVDSCMHWHNERMRVRLVTVMPDHVHLLLVPLEKSEGAWWPLEELLHSVKSFTSHKIQKDRGASGPLWQDEYFDRLVRDEDEFNEKWNYMLHNPVKAGLVKDPWDYPFTRSPEMDEARERQSGSREAADENDRASDFGGRDARPTVECELGRMKFYPERYTKTYQTWLENLRDWPISRQLWWGHRIPIWQGDASSAPSSSRQIASRTSESEKSIAFVSGAPEAQSEIQKLEQKGFQQDPDVLDTWFSSGLWPLSTMGWPDPDQSEQTKGLLGAFNPTNVLCTAREIITLWVSRMVMFNRYFLARDGVPGPSPFRDVFIHAMIQDGEGRKMSKSLGNGVDPLDIIATHGADAMRYTLCHMTTQTQDVRMPVERDEATGKNTSPKFDLGRNFCNKLWNAARFAISILESPVERASTSNPSPLGGEGRVRGDLHGAEELPLIDRWMLSRLESTVRICTDCIARYEYSDYAQAVYDLLWRDFCDWYLEAIKPTVRASASQRAVLRAALDTILRLLHPICPFVTESIYERFSTLQTADVPGLSLGASELLCLAPWPQAAPDLRDADAEKRFERLRTLTDAIREARSLQNVPPKRRITLHLPADAKALSAEIDAAGFVPTLAGLEAVTLDPAPTGQLTSPITFEAMELRLSGLIDASTEGGGDAERARLSKKVEELDKSIAALEGRLNNPGYAQRAPAHLVQQTRDQLDKARAEREAAATALAGIAG